MKIAPYRLTQRSSRIPLVLFVGAVFSLGVCTGLYRRGEQFSQKEYLPRRSSLFQHGKREEVFPLTSHACQIIPKTWEEGVLIVDPGAHYEPQLIARNVQLFRASSTECSVKVTTDDAQKIKKLDADASLMFIGVNEGNLDVFSVL